MNRIAIGAGIAGIMLLAGANGTTGTHDPRTNEYRACFEDEAIVWSGNDDAHTHCIPLDDLPRMMWQECVAHADGTDKELHACDDRFGKHDYRNAP